MTAVSVYGVVLLSKTTRLAPRLAFVSRVSWVDRLTLIAFDDVPATALDPEVVWRDATKDTTDLPLSR